MIFGYSGQYQTFTAEKDKKYVIDLFGAQGGGAGGYGGHTHIVYTPTANTNLYFYVGGEGASKTGGWNGGGAGGAGIDSDRTGYGGGGATDVRIGGTAISNRIGVAGGGGGSAVGNSSGGGAGGLYPYNSDGKIDWVHRQLFHSCGGSKGIAIIGGGSSGGAGGLAPTYISDGYTNDGTYYPYCGGGGGGGYTGGGGGSTGVIMGASNYTGVAGGVGGSSSSGVGGAGGAKTTGSSGTYLSGSGSGGGGSSWVNNTYSGVVSYICNSDMQVGNGVASIHEVLSKPIVEKVEKVGNKIELTISKDALDNGVEEAFYYAIREDYNTFDIDRSKLVIVNNSPITISQNVLSSKVGYHIAYFKVCSGLGDIIEGSYLFYIGADDNLTFNLQNKDILQGRFLSDFIVNTSTEDIPKKYQTKVVINGKQYGDYQEGNQIYLPLFYDGVSENEKYNLQLLTRVGKLLESNNGTKKYQWESWISSETVEVEPPIAPYNNLHFITPSKNQIVEKDSVLDLSWEGIENIDNSVEYTVTLYKGEEKILDIYQGQETNTSIVANLLDGVEYKFGLTLVRNKKFKSRTIFSDSFKVVAIKSSGYITISNDLKLITSLENKFVKMSILINNRHHKTLGNNVQNEQLPLWKMEKGTNNITIRVFSDEKYYFEQTYQVALYVEDDSITSVNQYNTELYYSIYDDSNYNLMTPNIVKQYKWGEVEEEHSGNIESENPIEIINQKITIKKIDINTNSFKGIQILGQID